MMSQQVNRPSSTLPYRARYGIMQGMLTVTQQSRFAQDGYLVLEGFVPETACATLVQHAGKLVQDFDPAAVRTVFCTRTQAHARDEYFLTSGGTVRFFLEESALGPDGGLIVPKDCSVNKIGHALHDLDPVFARFSRTPALHELVRDLGLLGPLLVQSMYIFKGPEVGGEVTCHQDATYLYTEPQSVVGLWFALADATRENGCLWAIPGGHRMGLKSRFVRDGSDGMRTEVLDPTPWPLSHMVSLEVPVGTLIVLHGLLPHMSHANTSTRARPAYTLHVMDSRSRYPADNWLQRPADMPFRGFE